MKCLDLTLPGPSANLACEEALLDVCDDDPRAEVLRFWEPRHYFVVIGYGNQAGREVNLDACARENIGVYRRCSGGGTVLQGPGCLNYSLILGIEARPALRSITEANCHIMQRHRKTLAAVSGLAVEVRGITDLAVEGLKFSGNAQRRKRRALIFHGTFLLDFDIPHVAALLRMPSREPVYRQNRPHVSFLTNLALPAATIKTALCREWSVEEKLETPPVIDAALEKKYSSDEWNLRIKG